MYCGSNTVHCKHRRWNYRTRICRNYKLQRKQVRFEHTSERNALILTDSVNMVPQLAYDPKTDWIWLDMDNIHQLTECKSETSLFAQEQLGKPKSMHICNVLVLTLAFRVGEVAPGTSITCKSLKVSIAYTLARVVAIIYLRSRTLAATFWKAPSMFNYGNLIQLQRFLGTHPLQIVRHLNLNE